MQIGRSKSSWTDVTSGVPQGSVLGPLLFIIYVNDLPDAIDSTAKLFADDTKIFRRIRAVGDRDVLQDDLDHACDWCKRWKGT